MITSRQWALSMMTANVYLAGVKPGEHMSVFWSGVAHCDINLPDPLPADLFNGLLLPCQHKGKRRAGCS